MKAFSFTAEKGVPQIGIEYKQEFYNFSLAWEFYKKLKNKGQGPELNFLQVMVEVDFFHLDTFQEVIFALQKVRPMDDLKLKPPYNFLPPVGRPQKILCVGRNYRGHAEELGNAVPEEPIFFCKAPSAMIAHEERIHIPPDTGRVDFEGELALVVGKQGHRIKEKDALDYIAGFSLLNDVTARDTQKKDQKSGRPWFRSKSFDTFCPFGPFLLPKEAIHDFDDLDLLVRLNGDVRQTASSSDMIFSFAEIISYISKYCTLVPGDVIATGTPPGVGELRSGDTVEVEVVEIGTLRNSVE